VSEVEPIVNDQASFSSDSQLLSELGERLIASRQVALTELIKNAYDADATRCNIWLEEDESVLIVDDDGHGMTEQEFKDHWMTIATSNRSQNPTSRKYNREVTGSKGVGRFAVRNLGLKLRLESVALDEDAEEYRRLVAIFNWKEFDTGSGLQEMEINYRVYPDGNEDTEGTTLKISKLRDDWSQEELEEVSDEVLDIVSAPYEPSEPRISEGLEDDDPGFSVYFAPPGEGSVAESPAKEIYDRWTARAEIELDGREVEYTYEHSLNEGGERTFTYDLDENLIGDLVGEIRFFKQTRGQFAGMDNIDGRKVSSWLKDNGGVRVIDKGFRIPPYGGEGNDWLNLSASQARREREWRSPITTAIFPSSELDINVRRAQLALPHQPQLLGAVEVSSSQPGESANEDGVEELVPAMDRQGFIKNKAFDQLREIVRGALEILSIIDKQEEKRRTIERAREKKFEFDDTTQSTIESIQEKGDLSASTKEELVHEVESLEKKASESLEAEREAREAVESMNLLGAVAAFMSHESNVIIDNAESVLRTWREIPEEERSEELQSRIESTEEALGEFRSHLGYAEDFMRNLSSDRQDEITPKSQVKHVVRRFDTHLEKKNIEVENEIDFELDGPEMNISVYSGVIVNLLTNAIKAVTEEAEPPEGNIIRFEAENTPDYHKLRVIDNGVGIDEENEDQIFQPLQTTTSDVEAPGSVSAGLGLYIVKRVVRNEGGDIELVEPPEGYATAFEVKYPL
jgi:signal transduction histidine kinase